MLARMLPEAPEKNMRDFQWIFRGPIPNGVIDEETAQYLKEVRESQSTNQVIVAPESGKDNHNLQL